MPTIRPQANEIKITRASEISQCHVMKSTFAISEFCQAKMSTITRSTKISILLKVFKPKFLLGGVQVLVEG